MAENADLIGQKFGKLLVLKLVKIPEKTRNPTINATIGPSKAANGKCLCYGFDSEGNKIQTLPRGFYLRSNFTKQII